jgi:hypothetical protein
MKYQTAIQNIDTEKALSLLGLETKKEGAYIRFLAPCGHEVVIKCYGEKKNVIYCPECKKGSNIFQLALDMRGINYTDLVEKTARCARPIEEQLNLNYELEWCAEMEKRGLSREFCQQIGVGKPKGKTMLSGCIAFTVQNEAGVKIAYYGIRIADRRPTFHRSFNPELYLFAYHTADTGEEVLVTTDLFSCLRHIAGGKQSVCNFGLPYLSSRQMELLSPFPRITFEWLFADKREIMLNVAQNLKTYHRFM